MSAQDHYNRFALYNRWANARLYDALYQVPTEEYKLDRGMFFKSIHGTLNHLMVADKIWLRRITGVGPDLKKLDEILYDHFSFLREAREGVDYEIIETVAAFSNEDYGREFSYQTTSGEPHSDILAIILTHFFNHQTHHRGQIHNCLSQIGVNAPSLDYIRFIREMEVAD